MSGNTQSPKMPLHSRRPSTQVRNVRHKCKKSGRFIILCTTFIWLLAGLHTFNFWQHPFRGKLSNIWGALGRIGIFGDFQSGLAPEPPQDLCPQAGELRPVKNRVIWNAFGEQLGMEEFKNKAAAWLSGAVRIPTESFDGMGPVDVDPRWEKFAPFHEYLEKSFPLIHSNLIMKKVNTYGLVYEWDASDSSLKPLLLAAHQDVVPVDPTTVDEWVHPPFSGFCDGERIWGRGSADDKSGLIGIMSAIETLLSMNFQPSRKIVLTFGFDEEVSGLFGAHELSKHLEATYGKESFAMLVDEGDGFSEQHGALFAIPAIAEKGYFDMRVEVSTPGGHSSIPPTHTSIGILSAVLVAYEANPMKPLIDRSSPVYGMMQCMAAHAPSMDHRLRETIIKSTTSDNALQALEKLVEEYPELSSSIATTQAIDLIQGGVKTNALPEQAWAVINHRIATQSSVAAVKQRDTSVIAELAEKFNLTLDAFGITLFNGSRGSLSLSALWDYALEPAPVTPTDAAPYKLLSGTIHSTYNSHRPFSNKREIKIAPGIMAGNTDTCSYWNLTKHIFRYSHQDMTLEDKVPGGIHTINESIALDNVLAMIRFFITLILNADEYEL